MDCAVLRVNWRIPTTVASLSRGPTESPIYESRSVIHMVCCKHHGSHSKSESLGRQADC